MRALYISMFVFLMTMSFGVVAQMNQLHIEATGHPLIPASNTGTVDRIYEDTDFDGALTNYSITSIPRTGDSNFLASNPSWTTNWAVIDTFLYATIGFGDFIKTIPGLEDMPQSICTMIGSVVFLNNILLTLSFLRGFWLSWRG
jgi:hypothetical protein